MNNNQEKSSYKETGDKVTSTLGAIGAGLESTAKEVSKNLDISNLGKTIIKWTPKPISSTLNVHSISTAQGEKEVFTEAYKMGVSGVTSGLGGGIGVVGCAVIPFINTAVDGATKERLKKCFILEGCKNTIFIINFFKMKIRSEL